MRMLFITAALALTATPAFAETAPTTTFEHEGVTYTYSTAVRGDVRIIQGTSLPGGQTFNLTVRGGRVSGTSGTSRVSFRLRDVKPVDVTPAATFASR